MSTSHLPPMPDPTTGHPRPPRAPVRDRSHQQRIAFQKAKLPTAPDEASPMLEWFAPATEVRTVGTLFIVGIMAAYLTLRTGGFIWATWWWMWCLIAGCAWMAYAVSNRRAIAGADWLVGKRGFVRTYDLVEIKIQRSTDWNVRLEDRHGGRTDTPLDVLQANRDLWDLVHNGMRHSVANGAEVNKRAREWFRL